MLVLLAIDIITPLPHYAAIDISLRLAIAIVFRAAIDCRHLLAAAITPISLDASAISHWLLIH